MKDSSILPKVYPQGSLIGDRYTIHSVLGQGAMSTVFLASDRSSKEQIAIKILDPSAGLDSKTVERFQREAKAQARLSHPNIVKIYTSGITEKDDLYIAMEYVRGETLAALLKREGKSGLEFEHTRAILCDIALGLSHAHEKGVIHRDLKPDNILIGTDGRAKITDFGLCLVDGFQGTITRSGECVGTPYYMSPELIRGGKADVQSDIYSFGIVAYELASGHVPFPGESWFEVAQHHQASPLPPLPETLPDWFVKFVQRCTEKRLEERLPHSGSLQFYLNPNVTLSQISTAGKRKGFRLTKNRLLLAALCCLALLGYLFQDQLAELLNPAPRHNHGSDIFIRTAPVVEDETKTLPSSTSTGPAESSLSPLLEQAPLQTKEPSLSEQMDPTVGKKPTSGVKAKSPQMYMCKNGDKVVFTNDPPVGAGWKCLAAEDSKSK